MSYSNIVEMIINQNNICYFGLYVGKGFNFIYPGHNEELKQYWTNVIGMYYISGFTGEYRMYDVRVFKTIPDDNHFPINLGSGSLNDKIMFDFPDEETALYFKLKFCN